MTKKMVLAYIQIMFASMVEHSKTLFETPEEYQAAAIILLEMYILMCAPEEFIRLGFRGNFGGQIWLEAARKYCKRGDGIGGLSVAEYARRNHPESEVKEVMAAVAAYAYDIAAFRWPPKG